MGKDESTPRATRRAAAASASKPAPESVPKSRGRPKKPDQPSAIKKKDEPAQRKEDEEMETEPPSSSLNSDPEDDLEVLRQIKPRRGKAAAAAKVVKEEEVDSNDEMETEPAREEKETRKPTRAAASAKKNVEVETPANKKQQQAPRSLRRGAAAAAAEDEDEMEVADEPEAAAPAAAAATTGKKKGKETKALAAAAAAPAARSTRKGRKAAEVVEEEEEEGEEISDAPVPIATSTARKRGGRKAAVVVAVEEEEEEESDVPAPPAPSTRGKRAGKKVVESMEEEEGEMSDAPIPVATSTARKRGGRKAAVAAAADAATAAVDEEEEEREVEKKKKRGEKEEEEAPTHSRARRRILDDKEEGGKKEEKGRREKTPAPVIAKRPERTKRGEGRMEIPDNSEMEAEEDVKPAVPFKPQLFNDLDTAGTANSDEERESEPEVTVERCDGMQLASDVATSRDTYLAKEAICTNIRHALNATYLSKDPRAFENAVNMIMKTREMAYHRQPHEETAEAFYDEITYQLEKNMKAFPKESKAEGIGKQRVLDAIAKASIKEFIEVNLDEYDALWKVIDIDINHLGCETDAHSRAYCCYWIGSMLKYSKLLWLEKFAGQPRSEVLRIHDLELADAVETGRMEEGGEDEDRRMLDGHLLKLGARKLLFGVLYTSLKHDESSVRAAAIRSLSIIQDDPIPPNFIEAVKYSPKDLIRKQLLDVHKTVRRAAMEELRPSTDTQIASLLEAAMNERHEAERVIAFTQLGRLPLLRFNVEQRHQLIGMLKDNHLGPVVERSLLRPWLHEMVTGQNPRPIIVEAQNDEEVEVEVKDKTGRVIRKKKQVVVKTVGRGRKRKEKKREGEMELVDKWVLAPLQLLRYLDCVNHSEDVLEVLKKGSAIARKESGNHVNPIRTFILMLTEACSNEGLGMLSKTDLSHLLDEDLTDDARATLVTFWVHCLQFVNANARDEADKMDAIADLAPSMAELRQLIMDLIDEERERRAPRAAMVAKGDYDINHPVFIRTPAPLQSVVTLLLSAFAYLPQMDEGMLEWRALLLDLSSGRLIDVSQPMWDVMMRDLMAMKEEEGLREMEDTIHEVAVAMGFDFAAAAAAAAERDEAEAAAAAEGSASVVSSSTDDVLSPSKDEDVKRREGEERRAEEKRRVVGRPDCLGMLAGALKTGCFTREDSGRWMSVLFREEMDTLGSVSIPEVRTTCLECIDLMAIYSPEHARRYIGMVMQNVVKPFPTRTLQQEEAEEEERERQREREEEKARRKRRKIVVVNPDELERDYERRDAEIRKRREKERARRRGGRNQCRGLAMVVMADLICAHGYDKIVEWLEASTPSFSILALFTSLEECCQDEDFDLVFKAAHAAFKISLAETVKTRGQLAKTIALLWFRNFHPSAFSHPSFRACCIGFMQVFGAANVDTQMTLVDVTLLMLSMFKDVNLIDKDIIERDQGNGLSAVRTIVVWYTPAVLRKQLEKEQRVHTVHGVLMKQLGTLIEQCSEQARGGRTVNQEYYKAILLALEGVDFSGATAMALRNIYDVVFTNMDRISPNEGSEPRKIAQRLVKTIELQLDTVNEIIRLNELLGIDLDDKKVRLPFPEEIASVFTALRKRATDAGIDLTGHSPSKVAAAAAAAASRLAAAGTGGYQSVPATPQTVRGKARMESERRRAAMLTLKKEPARSKSYATQSAARSRAAAAAERAEKAAASDSSQQNTPARTRTTRKRAARMPTIDESGSD